MIQRLGTDKDGCTYVLRRIACCCVDIKSAIDSAQATEYVFELSFLSSCLPPSMILGVHHDNDPSFQITVMSKADGAG